MNLWIWLIVCVLTYLHVRICVPNFRRSLRREGSSREVIMVFEILFALFWPLWWLGMYPVMAFIIGKR